MIDLNSILKFFLVFAISFSISNCFGQEKEFKSIYNQIKTIEAKNEIKPDLSELNRAVQDFCFEFPNSVLALYARSKYYQFQRNEVDSAYFIMKRASEEYNKLEEKTQSQYCKKFEICKDNFTPLLNNLIELSLIYYAKHTESKRMKLFLERYPKESEYYKKAEDYYQQYRYEDLKKTENISLHESFINEFPNSKYNAEIVTKIENLEYNELKKSSDTTSYHAYLKKYPNTPHRSEIEVKLIELRELAMRLEYINCSYNNECLLKFLNKHPNSNYSKEAFEKILKLIHEDYKNGKQANAIRDVKLLRSLHLEYNTTFQVDSILHSFEFYACKKENTVQKWDYFIKEYAFSEQINTAIQYRDSLVYFDLKKNFKNLDKEKIKIQLEEYLKNYPNSIYVKDAQQQINAIVAEADSKKQEEALYLQKYALYEKKVVRLFVCNNVIHDENEQKMPYRRKLAYSGSDYYSGKWAFVNEIEGLESFWRVKKRSSEAIRDYYLDFRNDSITLLKLAIINDYGFSTDGFPARNTDDLQLFNFFDEQEDENAYIHNYITTDISPIDANGFFYVSGFFVNDKHYQKDLDCFIAKVNSKETALSKKIVWLKEYSEKNAEGVHLNNWSVEMETKDQFVYLNTHHPEHETTILRFDTNGNLIWNQQLPKFRGEKVGIKILSNGNVLVFEQLDNFYGNMNLGILSASNAQMIKYYEEIALNPYCQFGSVAVLDNGFILAVNYIEYQDGSERKKSLGRAINMQNTVNYVLPNTILLKYNNNGELVKQKVLKSVEPRFIERSEIKNKSIFFLGVRGMNNYDEDYLNTFFIEIDAELNVISTNGTE